MKRVLSLVFVVCLLMSVLSVISVSAQTTEDGFSYEIKDGKVTITAYTGDGNEVVIPDTIEDCPVTAIGSMVFENKKSIVSVTIPDTVTNIGMYAFSNCTGLSDITIPRGVTSIGMGAFKCCDKLKSIIIPDSVTVIGDYAFDDCDDLTSVEIPPSVTTIGTHAFYHCDYLATVRISEGVTSMGDEVFGWSKRLENIDVDPNNNAFTSIDGVLFDKSVSTLYKYPPNKEGEVYEVPSGVVTIDKEAFYQSGKLKSITIPKTVTSIGLYAFGSCSKMEQFNIDSANPVYCSVDGVLFDKMNSILIRYPQNDKRDSYVIPEGTVAVGEGTFSGCHWLKNITIPQGVTSMGEEAFYGCSSLESIVIPEGVTVVEYYAFRGCRALRSVTIPESVTTIERSAFYECVNLESIAIPEGVEEIKYRAFYGCINLTSVILPPSVVDLSRNAFDGVNNLTIYGYRGSRAEFYATRDNFPFVALDEIKKGDVNNDGVVNIKDATAIQKHLALIETIKVEMFFVADFNEDDYISIKDATEIQKSIAGII